MTTKFCKDCRHFDYTSAMKFAMCTEPKVKVIDLVHGPRNTTCNEARQASGGCGPEAKLFSSAADGVGNIL